MKTNLTTRFSVKSNIIKLILKADPEFEVKINILFYILYDFTIQIKTLKKNKIPQYT